MPDAGIPIARREAVVARPERAGLTRVELGYCAPEQVPPRPASSTRRRRIVIVLFAGLTILGAESALRRADKALSAYDVADYTRKPNVYLSGPPGRILLLGSSRVKYGLSPAEFEAATGVPAFNLGIPGSKTVEWRLLLRRMLDQCPPAMVVLGINVSELRDDYLPTASARNLFSFADLCDCLASDGWSTDVAGAFLQARGADGSAAYRRRFEIRMWLEEHAGAVLPKCAQAAREHRARCERPIPPDGFEHPWLTNQQRANLVERIADDPENVVAVSTPRFSPDAPAVRHFAALLDDLHARGISLLVVYIPNSPRTAARWGSVERQAVRTIGRLCVARDVSFIPCDEGDIPRTDADFVEEVHVGLPLARRISACVAERIVALRLLPDEPPRLASNRPVRLGVRGTGTPARHAMPERDVLPVRNETAAGGNAP